MNDPDIRRGQILQDNALKENSRKQSPLRSIYGGLRFDGSEIVNTKIVLRPRDFRRQMTVIDENKIAKFDDKIIIDY